MWTKIFMFRLKIYYVFICLHFISQSGVLFCFVFSNFCASYLPLDVVVEVPGEESEGDDVNAFGA